MRIYLFKMKLFILFIIKYMDSSPFYLIQSIPDINNIIEGLCNNVYFNIRFLL